MTQGGREYMSPHFASYAVELPPVALGSLEGKSASLPAVDRVIFLSKCVVELTFSTLILEMCLPQH